MSHVIAWIIVSVAAITGHAMGGFQEETVAIVMVVSMVTLAAHRALTSLVRISDSEEIPFQDLHDDFMRWYFTAAKTSQPNHWMQAALAAKRWENAVTKPAHHKHHPSHGVRRAT